MCLGGYFCENVENDTCQQCDADNNFIHTHPTHLISGGLEFDRPVVRQSALCDDYIILFSDCKFILLKNS